MISRWSVRLKNAVLSIGIICQLLLLITISPSSTYADDSSMEEGSKEDSHNDLDPCDLMTVVGETAQAAGYCNCNGDYKSIVDANCGFHKNPSEKEWQAIARFESVTVIELRNRPANSIQQLPPLYVFQGMKKLLYYKMTMAQLGEIPSFAFANSTSIADIDLPDNSIHTLGMNAFANLKNVSEINLNENHLTEINRNVFVNLPKLKELVLSKNQIQVIHDNAFKKLKNLQDLALQNNNLTVITREVFEGLQRMRHLDLLGNMIEYLGDHVFAEMPALESLDLNKNMIRSISPNAFAGLKRLLRLSLRDNKLVNLHPGTFNHLTSIHFLDLRTNELETLNYALISPIYENLKSTNMQLYLEGNRFLCDCQILWIKTLYEETESEYIKEHIIKTSCDFFESQNKHVASSSSSTAFFHKEGDPSNITILASPLEETTTYAFESVRKVVNLTSEDLNCQGDNDRHKKNPNPDRDTHHPDTTLTYHHQTIPKAQDEEVDESHKQHVFSSNWNANSDSHQRHRQPSILSVGEPAETATVHSDEVGQHDTVLNEPQATAALEGADVGDTPPKSTSSADQKVDTSKMSSTHTSSSSSSGYSKFCNCDSVLISLLVCIGVTLIHL